MTLTLFCSSRKQAKGLGFSETGICFGKFFESDKGRTIRVNVQSIPRWRNIGEFGPWYRPCHNLDNQGSLWRGFHFGKVFCFRHYRLIATHVSFGPVTVSWVRGTCCHTDHRRTWTSALGS